MATYELAETVHVSVGGDDFDWSAGPVEATSELEERLLAALAARGAATLVDAASVAEPEPAGGPPDTEG